jgi:hypothetical protein
MCKKWGKGGAKPISVWLVPSPPGCYLSFTLSCTPSEAKLSYRAKSAREPVKICRNCTFSGANSRTRERGRTCRSRFERESRGCWHASSTVPSTEALRRPLTSSPSHPPRPFHTLPYRTFELSSEARLTRRPQGSTAFAKIAPPLMCRQGRRLALVHARRACARPRHPSTLAPSSKCKHIYEPSAHHVLTSPLSIRHTSHQTVQRYLDYHLDRTFQHQLHPTTTGPWDHYTITSPLRNSFTVAPQPQSILKKTPTYTNMPSIARQPTMPTVIHSRTPSSSSKKERVVGFLKDPVSRVSRLVNTEESWAAYDFELHAQKCVYCQNPYEVHRNHEQLCEVGHRLAQEVAVFLYNRTDGETYSTAEEENKLVRVEIPSSYIQVRGLLKAIERSIRHRSRTPFVSQDRSYYVAARTPARSRSVKVEQTPKKSRPRSGEIVDWPGAETTVEVIAPQKKRGSLYQQDVAAQRQNEKKYTVEVREPSRRDLREHRLSGYYR